ncbi:MAG: cytochrome c [Halopseudomonas sp.]
MSRITQLACAIALTSSIAAPIMAATMSPMEKAVKARQGYMQVSAFNIGILAAMIKGKAPYDAAQAEAAANNLKLASMMNNKAMWIPGTGNDNPDLKTKALPKIWQADSKIGEKAQAFGRATEGLVEVAGQGLDTMKPKFVALGKSCKGCHKSYRAADKK